MKATCAIHHGPDFIIKCIVQVVILGSPKDPEASKHVVNACAVLLEWTNRLSGAISRSRASKEAHA
jgi:hypothetical protein